MAEFETLTGGARRIKAGRCSFLFERLEPGIFYTCIEGSDTGEVKLSPLDELSAEYIRFNRPISWFIDAEKTTNISSEVFQIWTAWFTRNRNYFNSIHVLAPNKAVHLSVSIGKHISRSGGFMVVHKEREPFDQALAKHTKHKYHGTEWHDEPAVKLSERQDSDGTVTVSNDHSAFSIRRLSGDIVFSTVSGRDDGSLGNVPFDLMHTTLSGNARRVSWFLDASRVFKVSPQVTEAWINWIKAHRDKLQAVVLLTPTGAMPLGIDVAVDRLQAHPLIITCQSLHQFEERLETRMRGFSYRPTDHELVRP